MSAPVDVLAVMDTACRLHEKGAYGDEWEVEFSAVYEARAAVAELIERERVMREALVTLDQRVLPAAIRYRGIGPGDIEEAQSIVSAALARVGGAA